MKFLRARKLWLSISAALVVLSIALIAQVGLQIGIDFKGGQLLEAKFTDSLVEITQIRSALEAEESLGSITSTSVAQVEPQTFQFRTSVEEANQIDTLRTILTEQVGEWEEIRFENVGPTVGRDLTEKAFWGVGLASVAIILYVAWAFRTVRAPANSWRFGVTAIVTLLHDLVITVGIYTLLGLFYGFEVDALFVTALLTVMGYSVNDTIVTYDRIRENLQRNQSSSFKTVVNHSVAETVVRSLNTSLTLVLVLLSLLVLGGSSIRGFTVALLIGVVIGTYSSIFVAAQLLITWQNRRKQRSS